ncbi:hypothetical protein [Brevundimonas aurantiaca]|uniref:hypothetical protein n=1 Tax=Brevundimonas aurantiaca TaxID=74316 RepID=UPI00301AF515
MTPFAETARSNPQLAMALMEIRPRSHAFHSEQTGADAGRACGERVEALMEKLRSEKAQAA